jgi:hypothetical protein
MVLNLKLLAFPGLQALGDFWAKEVDFFPRKIVASMRGSGEKKPPGYSIVIKNQILGIPAQCATLCVDVNMV